MKIAATSTALTLVLLCPDNVVIANWEGSLPYSIYGDGDACTSPNFVTTAVTTSVQYMGVEGLFCETDEAQTPEGRITAYTKTEYAQCGNPGIEGLPDDAIIWNFYDCTSSDCSDCTSEGSGWTQAQFLVDARDNVNYCLFFASFPESFANATGAFIDLSNEFGIVNQTVNYQQYITPVATSVDVAAYWDLQIENSCVAAYIDGDVTAPPVLPSPGPDSTPSPAPVESTAAPDLPDESTAPDPPQNTTMPPDESTAPDMPQPTASPVDTPAPVVPEPTAPVPKPTFTTAPPVDGTTEAPTEEGTGSGSPTRHFISSFWNGICSLATAAFIFGFMAP